MGVCNCSMFCCTLLCAYSSFAIILMWKRKFAVLLSLSSWCLVIFVWLFLAVPWVCLQFVIVVFPDHTYLLFFINRFAALQFELKLQKCIRIGIIIFKIFIGKIDRRTYVRKSRFTAPLACHRNTKFPTVYPTIYLPR